MNKKNILIILYIFIIWTSFFGLGICFSIYKIRELQHLTFMWETIFFGILHLLIGYFFTYLLLNLLGNEK